jgi:hypothetical protein
MRGAVDITVVPVTEAQAMATVPLVDTEPEIPEQSRLGVLPVAGHLQQLLEVWPFTAAPYTTDVPVTLPPGLFHGSP